MLGAVTYLYVSYGRIIDERLHGERDRAVPRVFARPLTLQTGQNMSQAELIGAAQRRRLRAARASRARRRLRDRSQQHRHPVARRRSGRQGRDGFVPGATGRSQEDAKPPPPPPQRDREDAGRRRRPIDRVTLDAPLLTALMTGSREKRRRVALEAIPARMQEAVLAIEDRRFYYHPGVDPIRMVGAVFTNMFGDRPYLVGGSTITQQLARNFFLTEQMQLEQQTRQRSYGRKILEQFMSIILETKATKDEILELYLNDVYLGNRGSFALHGVAEASKIYFSKDVRNLTLSEAALIAGIIQSPFNHSPFNNPERAENAATSCCAPWWTPVTSPPMPRIARSRNRSPWSRAPSTTRRRISSTTSAMPSTPRFRARYRNRARSTSTRRSISTCSATRRKR